MKKIIQEVQSFLQSYFRSTPKEDIEDAIQEAYLRLFKKGTKLIKNNLIQTAKCILLDEHRKKNTIKRKNMEVINVSNLTPLDDLINKEEEYSIVKAMKCLSKKEREGLKLRCEIKSPSKIQKCFNIPINAFNNRYRRAIQKIRKEVNNECKENSRNKGKDTI